MDPVSLPFQLARGTLLLTRLGVRAATFPARAALRVAVLAAEQLADAARQRELSGDPPAPPPPAAPGRRGRPASPTAAAAGGTRAARAATASRRHPRAPLPPLGASPHLSEPPDEPARRRGRDSPEEGLAPPRGSGQAPPRDAGADAADVESGAGANDGGAVVVAESADPGAVDGAGAEVSVGPPWPNYSRMRAADVIDRVGVEPDAVLAAVLLHERSNRRRRSVIEAAERALARRSASTPR